MWKDEVLVCKGKPYATRFKLTCPFRSKDVALKKLHYEVSTNLGLLQSNMTYISEKRGIEYHWIKDIYKRLNLPMYDGIQNEHKKIQPSKKKTIGI